MKDIEDAILSFLQPHCGTSPVIRQLTGDGSTRRYFRITCPDGTFILCRDESLASCPGEDYPFLIIHGLMARAGIPVPEILDLSRDYGLILQEDMGDVLLEGYAASLSSDELKDTYIRVLDILCDIQSIGGSGSIPFGLSFDREKLLFEFDFFIQNMVRGYLKRDPAKELEDELRTELARITDILVVPELFVLNHRDYHSRNIMIHRGRLRIIDFQDARMGLPQYDLVSVLRDSYTKLDPGLYAFMTDYYYARARETGVTSLSRDMFNYYTDIMAFQRNVKALGSFGWLCSAGKKWFERYIPQTFSYLDEYARRREELRTAYRIIRGFFD